MVFYFYISNSELNIMFVGNVFKILFYSVAVEVVVTYLNNNTVLFKFQYYYLTCNTNFE